MLVNCSGQGLTSFPRVRAHKVKEAGCVFAHNFLISKDIPLGTTADDSAGPFAKQFGRGIQFNLNKEEDKTTGQKKQEKSCS